MSSTMRGSNFIPGSTVDGGRIFRNLTGKASVAVKNLQLRFSITGGPMRGLFGGLASFEGGDQKPNRWRRQPRQPPPKIARNWRLFLGFLSNEPLYSTAVGWA
ncbi:hypothetical protein Pyn_10176 [Prunus yedoensis var. nudiflora]|uniref:Uncharacterized protein n=1 Tax=Prunus yedoensis var. nudiflora TaxID=2094558 RepID=A0A314YRD6_PRUYE|nr:hypothetical protein Pyn_10176 [Prunus yedoensis var. nudiflora]